MTQREKRKQVKSVADKLADFLTRKLEGTQRVRVLLSDLEPFAAICLMKQPSITITWERSDFSVVFDRYVMLFVDRDEMVDTISKLVSEVLGEGRSLLRGISTRSIGYSVKE